MTSRELLGLTSAIIGIATIPLGGYLNPAIWLVSGVLIAGGFVLLYTERVRHRDRESRNDHAQFNVGDSFDMSGGRRAIPNKRREIAEDEASGADGDGD